MRTNTIKKHFLFTVLTVLTVFITAFFLCGTVVSRSTKAQDMAEEVYINLARDFLEDIRYKLTTHGYDNCGINLTRCVDETGFRTYHINLHHKYLSNLDDAALASLYAELSLSAFPFENCSFSFSLI